MSSQARTSREEERRLSVRTLVIASAASAMAAIVTSQFWTSGTPIAAALTPVIVTLVSELLHRPTQRIAKRFTAETDALPEAAGAGPPPRNEEYDPRPAREPPVRGLPPRERPEFRVHQSRPAARRLPWKSIIATAAIAFVLAAAALTRPELIAGQSVGRGDRNFTLIPGKSHDEKKHAPVEGGQTEPEQTQPETAPVRPEQTVPKPQPKPQETTPTAPEPTQPPTQSTPTPRAPPSAPQQP